MQTTMAQPRRTTHALRTLAIATLTGLLGACAQPAKPMYSWDAYQPTVYAYLKEDGADYTVQAQELEKNVEKARATNTTLPPGFRAHLGMLYLKMGDEGKGIEQLEGEKAAFPEAAPFMDFLLRNAKKPVNAAQANQPVASDGAGTVEPIAPNTRRSGG